MERFNGFQSPSLAFLPFGLGPPDGFAIGRQNQASAGIGDLHAASAGFQNIEKKGLLDGVLVPAGLDLDAVLQEDIGCEQNFLAAVYGVRDVMKTALGSSGIF